MMPTLKLRWTSQSLACLYQNLLAESVNIIKIIIKDKLRGIYR